MLMVLIEHMDLRNITLVCQDWGGLLGLTLPMEMTDRFSRILVMNTTLGTGDAALSNGFLDWRAWVKKNPDLSPGRLLQLTCPHLSQAECDAYEAPFPDIHYKAGVRRFPDMVPDSPGAPGASLSRAARDWLRNEWNGQTFMAVGMKDPVFGPQVMLDLRNNIRNCPEPFEVPDGGHFVQEWGRGIAEKALTSYGL